MCYVECSDVLFAAECPGISWIQWWMWVLMAVSSMEATVSVLALVFFLVFLLIDRYMEASKPLLGLLLTVIPEIAIVVRLFLFLITDKTVPFYQQLYKSSI